MYENNAVRILIVSNCKLVRTGVRAIFSGNSLWVICGEAENGAESVSKADELKPDLVVLDLRTPGLDGFESLLRIHQIGPTAKIIILTPAESRELEFALLQAGVDADNAKHMLPNKLLHTLQWLIGVTTSNLHDLIQTSFDRNEATEE
jgi:DNA-binding NarL/FixJ family response regulator